MNVKEAKEKTVYLVDTFGNYEKRMVGTREFRGRLIPTRWAVSDINFYELVCLSAEQGTNPDGAGNKLFVKEKEVDLSPEADEYNPGSVWELRYWQPDGRTKLIETFESEDEANEDWFARTYKYDFLQDDQVIYYSTEDEAKEAIYESISEEFDVKKEVAASIFRKMTLVNDARMQRMIEENARALAAYKAEDERIEKLAAVYAAMVEKMPGESSAESARRLGEAINHQRIEKKVFWAAVKMINKN